MSTTNASDPTTPDPSADHHTTQPDANADAIDDTSPQPTERLVPVTEAIRYRKRAQAAEQELQDSAGRVEALESDLAEARGLIDHLERRQQIDRLLADADAVDLEVARLLTEAAVEMMDDPDVQTAVDDLVRTKPYLFRHRRAPAAQAMSAHAHDESTPAAVAAQHAATTGRRQDLLRYLRLRRTHA